MQLVSNNGVKTIKAQTIWTYLKQNIINFHFK